MPIDPQFAESLKPHYDCPAPSRRTAGSFKVGKMVRLYYPNRETLRWVPVGSMCVDCGKVEIYHRGRCQSPEKLPPRT